MKTTIEIADILMQEAKAAARAEGTTLRALVEQGLEKVLRERHQRKPYKLRDRSVKGKGLQPGARNMTWEQIREMIYEDRAA